MNKRIKTLTLLLLLWAATIQAQQDTVKLYLRPNITKESIQLRWTSNSPASWYFTNKNGVTIERYTLMRNGSVLDTPEKKILTAIPLKPPVLDEWKDITQTDSYAAIIAQALYGKDFEVSGGRKGIGEIIALSQEQEQRYAMSMYAADLSYPAALFAGWGYEDQTAIKGERYLYRLIPEGQDPQRHIEIASAYVSLDDYEELPRPLELDAIFGNGSVLLTWNYKLLLNYYNTYHIEKSEDGKHFNRLNKTPLTNISDGDRIFYTDSILNNKSYYYRVIGLTPFGQEGPASDTIQGMGKTRLIHIPQIIHVNPYDTGGVEVEWEFNEAGNAEVQHFQLQRSDTDKGPFETVVNTIAPDKRSVFYPAPLPENYLRIVAIAKEGESTHSFPRLLQMADSIPPAIPQGLKGEIDSLGVVRLTWDANTEADLLGYRIFRGQTENEELVPMNDIAHKLNQFTDTISLLNLNAKVYYAVTAIDQRYNQSEQCTPIVLVKPLKVKPAPPYISRCEATDRGIELEWIPGPDESITSYSIWRGEQNGNGMKQIKIVSDAKILNYTDSTGLEGANYAYEIRSINQGNMESDPSPKAYAKSKIGKAASVIKKFSGSRTEKGISLQWELTSQNVVSVSIYRKDPESSFYLWKELDIWENKILDDKAKRNTTYEYMLVLKDQQGRPIHSQITVN